MTDNTPATIFPATTEPQQADLSALSSTDWWQPSGIEDARQMCKWAAASEMVPKGYVGRPMDIFIAWSFAAPVGLSLLAALQSVAVINGKPSLYGDAIPAVVQRAGGYFEETITGTGDSMTAVCKCYRDGRVASTQEFSVADAKKAGLWGKKGPWGQYPKRMLQVRARAFAARDAFADKLSGFAVVEEVEDTPERNVTAEATVRDTPPAATGTASLKAKLRPEPATQQDDPPNPAGTQQDDPPETAESSMDAAVSEVAVDNEVEAPPLEDLYDEVVALIAELCDHDDQRIGEATLRIEDKYGVLLSGMDYFQLTQVRDGLEAKKA